ncbi:hypothetical protein HY989_05270 [Candidatus Micrarchaeota archaeon]|nr:hypothetical protein [Candidatus Micrarchaeota archaeon]
MIGPEISQSLRKGQTPMGMHPIYSHPEIAKLTEEEYKLQINEALGSAKKLGIVLNISEKSSPQDIIKHMVPEFLKVHARIAQIEKPHLERIKELAKKAACELNDISGRQFDELFKKNVNLNNSERLEAMDANFQKPNEAIKPEFTEKANKWIAKRLTHDLVTQGVAISHLRGAPAMLEKDLLEINRDLPNLYRLHSSMIQISNFVLVRHFPAEKVNKKKRHVFSYSKLNWKEGKVQAQASGTNFPTLVQELSKAIMDVQMAHALPREGDLTERELEAFKTTKNLSNEPWQYLLGPQFAKRLENVIGNLNLTSHDGEDEKLRSEHKRVLFSLIPEKQLHSILPNFYTAKEGSSEWNEAISRIKISMIKAEKDYLKGKHEV